MDTLFFQFFKRMRILSDSYDTKLMLSSIKKITAKVILIFLCDFNTLKISELPVCGFLKL